MLNPEDIDIKSMRKLTSAVIVQARKDINHGSRYRILEVIKFTKDSNNYWWECLDQFCGLNSDKYRRLLREMAKQKLKVIRKQRELSIS